MMLDSLYYVVLSYYSRKTIHQKDTPILTVFFIFTYLFFCLFLDMFIIGSLFLEYPASIHRSKILLILLGALCMVIVYLSFFRNGRSLKVYKNYRRDTFLNNTLGRRFYWCVLIVIFTSPFTIALLINKFVFGYWVH